MENVNNAEKILDIDDCYHIACKIVNLISKEGAKYADWKWIEGQVKFILNNQLINPID